MKPIKKILSLFFVLLLLGQALAACTTPAAKSTEDASGQVPSSPAQPSETLPAGSVSGSVSSTPDGEDDGQTPDDLFTPMKAQANAGSKHRTLEELPSYCTLVGSDTLPAVDNQGGIGCCASQAITYMQFTNAAAQYEKYISEGVDEWSPSTDYSQCFSPKFTYQYAGASTANVYNVLTEQGALKNIADGFAKDAGGGSQSVISGKKQFQTLRVPVYEGAGKEALQYRLTGYEQTFVTNNALYTASGKRGVAMTTSEAGRTMIRKIKEAVATGNVVVTGGYVSSWQLQRLNKASGNLAKNGDYVVPFATSNREGGHQVSIVGYDDDFEVKAGGVTMKGAFLIANSWGKGWGKNGYAWFTYDALNSESEYEEFALPKALQEDKLEKDWALDQFCFVYWDQDVTKTLPKLFAELEVSVKNRDGYTLEVTRTDASGNELSVVPYVSEYLTMHETYNEKGYLNFDGVAGGEETDGFLTVSFERLFSVVPEGKTYEDYDWSVKVHVLTSDSPLTVKSVKLYAGETLVTTLAVNDKIEKGTRSYTFSFGKAREDLADSFLSGACTLENLASGKFLAKDGVMNLKTGTEKEAMSFIFAFDAAADRYKLYRDDEKYVVEAVDGLLSGVQPRFNAVDDVRRYDTQNWKVSYNEDGTCSLYLTTEKGTNYALSVENDRPVLAKATELTDAMKWKVRFGETDGAGVRATLSDGTLTVAGTLKKAADGKIEIYSGRSGELLAQADVSRSGKTFTAQQTVAGEDDLFVKVLYADGTSAGICCFLIR